MAVTNRRRTGYEPISQAARAEFEHRGYLLLRGVLDQQQVTRYRDHSQCAGLQPGGEANL